MLDGSRIVSQTWGDNIFVFIYDENGSPIGINYTSAESNALDYFVSYYFEKNLQGDIVAIYNSSGTKVGTYTYDAWGNVTQTYLTTNNTDKLIVNSNPFRYRGYYYDSDTKLYYLKTRYYNPANGRFLNGDGFDVIGATPMGLTDKNLYAYCDNNPIMRVDSGGDFWNFVIGAGAGAIIGGVVSAVSQLSENPDAWKTGEFWAHVGIDAMVGAINGTVCASGLGVVTQAALNGVTSGIGDMAHQAIDKGVLNVDLTDSLKVACASAATSAICSGVANKYTKGISTYANNQKDIAKNAMSKAMGRMDAGKSYSAIMRQSTKSLHRYFVATNVKQGASSVIGSMYGAIIHPFLVSYFGG